MVAAAARATSAFTDFTVNYQTSQYLIFGSMVIPSNDYFIGDDSPTACQIFDNSGNFITQSITLRAADIWDAGSELFDLAHAAFFWRSAITISARRKTAS